MKPESRQIPLFDLGNVIVKVDFSPFLAWLTARSRSKDRRRAEAVLTSRAWYDLELGRISREEFARELSEAYQAEFTVKDCESAFCSIFPGLVPGMVELLRDLRKSGPVYALSNTNEVHLEWLRINLPESLDGFTKVFASHELQLRKPDRQIYEEAARSIGVGPSRLIFFDDVEANVQGARAAGLEAHLFTDTGLARERLKGI